MTSRRPTDMSVGRLPDKLYDFLPAVPFPVYYQWMKWLSQWLCSNPTIYKHEDIGMANPNVEVLCSSRNTTQSSEYQTYLQLVFFKTQILPPFVHCFSNLVWVLPVRAQGHFMQGFVMGNQAYKDCTLGTNKNKKRNLKWQAQL